MPYYGVTSGEYDYTEWVDEHGGPTYTVCAYVEVEAQNAREAKVRALRTKEFDEWQDIMRGDRRNPFNGLKTIVLPDCWKDNCDGCKKCEHVYYEAPAS